MTDDNMEDFNKDLDCSHRGIKSVKGMELTYVTKINLDGNEIADISPLFSFLDDYRGKSYVSLLDQRVRVPDIQAGNTQTIPVTSQNLGTWRYYFPLRSDSSNVMVANDPVKWTILKPAKDEEISWGTYALTERGTTVRSSGKFIQTALTPQDFAASQPTIVRQPADITAQLSDEPAITARGASRYPGLTVRWEYFDGFENDWADMDSGNTSEHSNTAPAGRMTTVDASLVLDPDQFPRGVRVRAVFSTSHGEVTSRETTMTVARAPRVYAAMVDQKVCTDNTIIPVAFTADPRTARVTWEVAFSKWRPWQPLEAAFPAATTEVGLTTPRDLAIYRDLAPHKTGSASEDATGTRSILLAKVALPVTNQLDGARFRVRVTDKWSKGRATVDEQATMHISDCK